MKQKAVIYLNNGVSVKLEITTEPKHYSEEQRDEALEALARKLGGSFSYVEHVEEELK